MRAAVMAAVLAWAAASPAASEVIDADDGYLAEAGFQASLSGDVSGVDASMRWHINPNGPWIWNVGAKLGASWVDAGDDTVTAGTIGVLAGYSYDAGDLRPTFEFALGKPFSDGGRFDLETSVGAGVRWRLAGTGRQDFAVRAMLFRTEWSGSGAQPDVSSYAIGVGIYQARLAR